MFRFSYSIFLFSFSLGLFTPSISHSEENTSGPNSQQKDEGKVVITANVSAEIIINHKVVGKTPMTINLPAGQHK